MCIPIRNTPQSFPTAIAALSSGPPSPLSLLPPHLRLWLASFPTNPTSKKRDQGGMVQPRTLGLGARGDDEARLLIPRRGSSRADDVEVDLDPTLLEPGIIETWAPDHWVDYTKLAMGVAGRWSCAFGTGSCTVHPFEHGC
ncbi:hypothetical protein CRG98_038340 [Punica granatum]|uniref:Uncharacterized protein n=1 Tax=Punica granatum TaxID=22663 RepID=A0A2I0IB60_PUNGR|nr:hypothetical protein CRG98_038340 [Punica granatum]